MATTNELFHDALVRRQIYLGGYANGLSERIIRLLDATERDLRLELADRLPAFEGRDFRPTTLRRLETLANVLGRIRSGAFDSTQDLWDDQMRKLAETEADYLDQTLKSLAPVTLDTVIPSATLLSGLVDTQPLQGRLLAEWAKQLQAADQERMMDAIRIGMAQGESTDAITRRVIGSGALDGADGATAITRRDATAITDTAVKTIAGESRQAYMGANSDIIETEVYTAVLDSRTTPECRALDGNHYAVGVGPQPPIHWRCRSTRVAAINGDRIGNRPAVSATEKQLAGLSPSERRARVKELVGTVPAKTTYQQFLERQTAAFQDEVLGPARGALFREGGLTLDRFVSPSFRQYTLDELRGLEPEAFRRAGLD